MALIAVLDVGLVLYCIYSGLKARPPSTCNKWKLLIANNALCSPRIPRHAPYTQSGRGRAPLNMDPHHTAHFLRVWSCSRGIMYVRTGFSPWVERDCHTSGAEGVWCTRRMGEGLWCVALHRAVRAWIIMPGMTTTAIMCLGLVTFFFLRLLPRTFGWNLCCVVPPRVGKEYDPSALSHLLSRVPHW